LTGGHWVTDVPAWLVIVHDLSFVPSMSNTPVAGYALAVFQDADPTKTITGIDETGGAEPVLY
jgi:hypothetical protein